jgi:hypothetical protein
MKQQQCLIDQCNRKVVSKGLCSSCYQTAIRYIKNGKTTWVELEKNGLAKTIHPKGKFSIEFRRIVDTTE